MEEERKTKGAIIDSYEMDDSYDKKNAKKNQRNRQVPHNISIKSSVSGMRRFAQRESENTSSASVFQKANRY